MNITSRSQSFNRRALGFGSPKAHRMLLFSRFLRALIVIVPGVSVISFFLAVGSGYIHVLPSQAFQGFSVSVFNDSSDDCDAFDGSWVIDDSYPLYNASECPFAERGFDCLGNGRIDKDYVKWRWKPKNCDIPKFDVQTVLEMLRGKRIVFVGDSMSRTQWESLICLLMTGVEDKRSIYEVNGNNITKRIRYLGVRFSSFNFTVEFFRSVFLVQHNWAPKHAPKRVRSTLRLDKLDDIAHQLVNSDFLIFNSGQWWVTGKLFGTGCYFQVGKSLKLGMPIATAFRTAIETWASWVETVVDTNRTHVFFRTFEPSHWSDPTLRYCNVTQQLSLETGGKEQSQFSDTVMEVVTNRKVPVTVLHVTSMSAFRTDAHVGTWSDNASLSDCSHWCLPGVPDAWNEIFLSYVLANHRSSLP